MEFKNTQTELGCLRNFPCRKWEGVHSTSEFLSRVMQKAGLKIFVTVIPK